MNAANTPLPGPSGRKPSLVACVGWDVGGWMGANNGVAVCTLDLATGAVVWRGLPLSLPLPPDGLFTVAGLVEAVSGPDDAGRILREAHRIVVGVDAPLGFPAALRRLLNGEPPAIDRRPPREIDNPLAYRFADRYLYEAYGKKPMSAAFDRIGNNATVAMIHARQWVDKEGFALMPQSRGSLPAQRPTAAAPQPRHVIEVYPAMLKRRGEQEALPWVRPLLPPGATPGSHAYDACLCALTAAAYAANGACPPLPQLIGPPAGRPELAEEGWIYHAPPS